MYRHLIAMALMLFFSVSLWASGAPDCALCAEKQKALAKIELEHQKNVELLGKNREYLAALSAEQASKILKVESNTVLILKKLDELKAKARAIESEYEKEGCVQCPQKK